MSERKDDRFNGSIDEKNAQLLKNLEEEAGVQIEFKVTPEKESWSVYPRFRYVINAPDELPNSPALTHELLHIMMDICGFVPTHILVNFLSNRNCRFDTSHIPRWENSLCHCKMIYHFKNLGYAGMQFIPVEGVKLYSGEEMSGFNIIQRECSRRRFNNEIIPPFIISSFIGMLIITKEYELQFNDYDDRPFDPEDNYEKLWNSHPVLFEALKGELDAWVSEIRNYSNVDFYNRINAALEKLGYPIADPY